MMVSRVLPALFAIFASIFLALGSPVPATNETESELDLKKHPIRTGRGEWFHVGVGTCGKRDTDSDLIVAISKTLYDRTGGSHCDQYVRVTNTRNGNTAYGLMRDSCLSCRDQDLGMSPALFEKLDSLDKGVITVSWNFQPKGWKP